MYKFVVLSTINPIVQPSLMPTRDGLEFRANDLSNLCPYILYIYAYMYNQINNNAASVPRPCRSWKISTMRPINLASVLWKFTTRLWPMSTTWALCRHWSTIAIRLRLSMKVESMLPPQCIMNPSSILIVRLCVCVCRRWTAAWGGCAGMVGAE